jgi:hypothetical protein
MIIYLDQNKWIELARIANKVEVSEEGERLLAEFNIALDSGCIFPLSAVHFVEFSRIKDPKRRSRLGKVMWKYSKNFTTAPSKEIVCFEIEVALKKLGYRLQPRLLNYIGRGMRHAFGEKAEGIISKFFESQIDEAMLCGWGDIPPIEGGSTKYRENFSDHLISLNDRKRELEKDRWDNWLYAIAMIDILEPLIEVMSKHQIPFSDISTWGEKKCMQFVSDIPTRKVDIHLHRQVLRNSEYRPKQSDLEDWSGLGTAVCYCDVVVCEKHFSSIIKRDSFKTRARVETSIYEIFRSIA